MGEGVKVESVASFGQGDTWSKSLFALIAWCFLMMACAACTPQNRLEHVPAEMPSSKTAGEWKKADRATKRQFMAEYRAAGADNRAVYKKYLPILGASAILDFLEKQNTFCHGEAHNLGKELYAQTQDIGQALGTCGNRCTAGCMHGVVGEAFGDKLHEDVASNMERFCQSEAMRRDHKPGNCAHAMGHALMIANANDLSRSLNACKEFAALGMEYYCATGVFMQHQFSSEEAKTPANPKDDPTALCRGELRFPAACYRYMFRLTENSAQADRDKIVAICQSLANAHQQRGCFHGVGNLYSMPIVKNHALLAEICRHGDAESQTLCIEGAIEKLADYHEKLAEKICGVLTGPNLESCLAATRHKMYSLDKPSLEFYLPST